MEGDIIFQKTSSPQAKAVKAATNSRYTHMGIIFKKRYGKKISYNEKVISPEDMFRSKKLITVMGEKLYRE